VGNKLFYFTQSEVQQFRQENKNGYTLLYIPNIFYEKSLVFKNWCNYYGDINFGIKALSAFFLYPPRYSATWILLVLLLVLYKNKLSKFGAFLVRHKKGAGLVLFGAILFIAFVLRWNGYVRHSGWTDEIHSATVTGNPTLPFLAIFNDNGNPPFYFMLLRWWFMLFGWTEEAGTMLSVVLGTLACGTLYVFVKPFFGSKTALCAAFFVAISGFVIGYSQEMRSYIFKICFVPLAGFAFLNCVKRISFKNVLLYIVLGACIVNAHYYGILFIMANFFFFVFYKFQTRSWKWKQIIAFSAANIVIALSFMPFFLYMILVNNYNFSREFKPGVGHVFLFCVLAVLVISFFIFKKDLRKQNERFGVMDSRQILFSGYILVCPILIYCLSFGISFVKPMITFRYLWPVCAPFMFALAAVFVRSVSAQRNLRYLTPLLVYMFAVALNGIIPDIPSGGTEGYREARAYIAADTAAHTDQRAALLIDTSENAKYYGYAALPVYSPDSTFDVLYVYNDIFHMHEMEMYDTMRDKHISDSNILKVYFDYNYPREDGGMIIKKYLRE
jgi:uncharacterized membrane protein